MEKKPFELPSVMSCKDHKNAIEWLVNNAQNGNNSEKEEKTKILNLELVGATLENQQAIICSINLKATFSKEIFTFGTYNNGVYGNHLTAALTLQQLNISNNLSTNWVKTGNDILFMFSFTIDQIVNQMVGVVDFSSLVDVDFKTLDIESWKFPINIQF